MAIRSGQDPGGRRSKKKKNCWRDRMEVKGLCASMMIFHFEQTSWASQREGGIDLHSSNHNTSTFTQVYFLAFYQDFINYFRWQIDLLLFGPSSLLSEGKPGCVCLRLSLPPYGNVYTCRCCLLWRHHLPSGLKVQRPHGEKANVTAQAGPMPSPDKWRQE